MERKKIALSAGLGIAALIVIFLPGFSELQRLREERDDARKRIALLEQHNDILREEVRRMKQDPAYVEKKAREKLGIIKKGEFVYRSPSEKEKEYDQGSQ